MAELMTPDHPRWNEFAETLKGPEYCNFHEEEPGNPNSVKWQCKGGMNKPPFAKAILEKMSGFDVEASLKYFEENGGHCDCEILFNVDPGD
ncbi:MAG: DUF2695 domain-containing protein [Candidatus Sungbacteria bacterium]|nr:DUF2695 domain-containing protein [Candidatus Sungbacteria bacterium]